MELRGLIIVGLFVIACFIFFEAGAKRDVQDLRWVGKSRKHKRRPLDLSEKKKYNFERLRHHIPDWHNQHMKFMKPGFINRLGGESYMKNKLFLNSISKNNQMREDEDDYRYHEEDEGIVNRNAVMSNHRGHNKFNTLKKNKKDEKQRVCMLTPVEEYCVGYGQFANANDGSTTTDDDYDDDDGGSSPALDDDADDERYDD